MPIQLVLLLIAGFLAGVINSIAGGGSFILYPLLLGLGVPPISANASCTIAVLPGTASSAYGYGPHIQKLPKRYFLLLIPGLAGGLVGAVLLGHTPNRTFEYIVPWFVLAASALLMLQPKIHAWLYKKENQKIVKKHLFIALATVGLGVFALSIYGGYFGAGYGIMMLAFLGFTELTDIHQMNGLKNLVGIMINTTAVFYFITHGLISWKFVPALMIGNVIGGLLGARYSSKMRSGFIRGIIIGIALAISLILFARAYLG
jgi:uncharacterized membrane protein YfcA